MFWHMGLSTVSPVDTILDKEHFTLEELLDEDEIIQEVKALNGRLISFLQEKSQVNQLVQYIVEEAPEDAKKPRIFKFPFVACEIFTCEVDIILKALVEDDELMDLLFSFLDPGRPHSTLLAGYFSKVVVCLLLRKTAPLMNYIRAHQDIINKLVDLIGITSIMEVLIRLIGVDEHIYANYGDSMQWFEDMNVLEMIVDKFSSSGHGLAERDDEVCIFTASRLFNHGFLVIMTWLLMVMASEWPSKVTTMDVYFDDASAEVVISSLRLGHEQESGSLFTNSDWFAFEDQRIDSSIASPSPKGHVGADGGADDVIFEKDKDLVDSTIFSPLELNPTLDGNNVTSKLSEDMRETTIIGLNKPPEWVEWRESSDSIELPPPLSSPETSNTVQCPSIPNGEPMESGVQLDDVELDKAESLANVHCKIDGGGSPDLNNVDSSPKPIQSHKWVI
ncbi:Serine/threonine-protein phosphatase 6 regulatory subunit [Sesamum angolense]|uniref:Serine/threonine-protein phosphatase 6 regulatory subunit n=1 Tax=Sesamum angolense TaxID=2727404 RepID=A0AAE2BIC1_9LAMI|nr:Serine/threonine-protein phosphatase 6 regulatory subunit [Sesamum angolense]